MGVGHSAIITAIRFSPNNKYIVSTSASGSIFVWYNPMYKHEIKEAAIKDTEEKSTAKKSPIINQEENVIELPSSRSSVVSRTVGSDKEGVCPCSCKRPIQKRACCACPPKLSTKL